MTVRLSTGARNGLANNRGFASMFNRGYAEIYAGSQPTSADAASTSFTKLGIVSAVSGAPTKETRATGTYTLSGTLSGSVNTLTVGGLNIIPDGAVAYNTSLNQTASDLCDAVNRMGMMEATVSGAVVTLRGRPGSGAITPVIAGTTTGLTGTGSTMSGGVTPLNGLIFGAEALGIIAKLSTQVWSCAGIAAGTAAWFRLFSGDTADSGALLSAAPWYPRLDGSCGVGSGDMQLSTLAFTIGPTVTVDVFSWTQPANA